MNMPLGSAALVTVVCEDDFDRQSALAMEGQRVVVQDRHRSLGLLGDIQEPQGLGPVGVYHSMQVDLTDAFEGADEEGVGREQVTRCQRSPNSPYP
ncbi:MAG: hypothetical protein F4Y62_04130 [Rhodospirillaceae bacterium]|nr:hypothetical protein [Rhodospirillaceae bacterium]